MVSEGQRHNNNSAETPRLGTLEDHDFKKGRTKVWLRGHYFSSFLSLPTSTINFLALISMHPNALRVVAVLFKEL